MHQHSDQTLVVAEEAPGGAFAQRGFGQRGEKSRWANLRHVNGVAVYQEHAEQSGDGGAFMVSAVVRATPKACFKVRPYPKQHRVACGFALACWSVISACQM